MSSDAIAEEVLPHERPEILKIVRQALKQRYPEPARFKSKELEDVWEIVVLPVGRGRGGGGKVTIDKKKMRAVEVLFYQ